MSNVSLIQKETEIAFKQMIKSDNAWSDMIDIIKKLKFKDQSLRMNKIVESEQSELAALNIESLGAEADDYMFDGLLDCDELTRVIVNYMKLPSAANAFDLANSIKLTIVKSREEAINKIIDETNARCCGKCQGYIAHDDDRCHCEIGKCYNCREEDYHELEQTNIQGVDHAA